MGVQRAYASSPPRAQKASRVDEPTVDRVLVVIALSPPCSAFEIISQQRRLGWAATPVGGYPGEPENATHGSPPVRPTRAPVRRWTRSTNPRSPPMLAGRYGYAGTTASRHQRVAMAVSPMEVARY